MAPDPTANMQSSLAWNTGSEAPKRHPALPFVSVYGAVFAEGRAGVLHETQAGISKEGSGRKGALHRDRHGPVLMAPPLGHLPK